MPKERGGQGLSVAGMTPCYEEMNRSIFGPVCFNSAAPDDGNMIILNKIGTDAQKERWLQPIIDGKVRSSFAMTEPSPGSGSDPSAMQTTAKKKGDTWVVNGRKWFITGAGEAQHFVLIARTSDDTRRGLSAFLFDADQPGWEILRRIPIMGPEEHGPLRDFVRWAGNPRREPADGGRRRAKGRADPPRHRAADPPCDGPVWLNAHLRKRSITCANEKPSAMR